MKQFIVHCDTGVSGYEITEVVEADGPDQAKEKAIAEAEEKLRYMIRRLKAVKVEED